uniref:Uncharacterized protein n=1 Tax=viral metagenome TaxID=1070528 RepID=A0A6M3Y5M5_9ZZZZ
MDNRLKTIQCPHCNQIISGVISEIEIPRIKIKALMNLKDEILSNIEAKTGWGKNEIFSMISTVIDKNLEDV